jgi:hypothetical protein
MQKELECLKWSPYPVFTGFFSLCSLLNSQWLLIPTSHRSASRLVLPNVRLSLRWCPRYMFGPTHALSMVVGSKLTMTIWMRYMSTFQDSNFLPAVAGFSHTCPSLS